jgi:hypothetical protein
MGGKTDYGPNLQALEYGLAWYLPCSFAGRPIYGEFSARALKLDRPNIGDLSQPINFEPFTSGDEFNHSFLYERGGSWASLFWEIRNRLGQQVADALVIQAWQKTSVSSGSAADRLLVKRFNKELLVAAENVPKDARSAISTILKDRGFPL